MYFGEMECCGYTWHSAGNSREEVVENLYHEWKKEVGIGTNNIHNIQRFEEWYGIRIYNVEEYVGKVGWD